MTKKGLRKNPIPHRLELLERNEWHPDLFSCWEIMVTPSFKVLGEPVKITLLNVDEIGKSLETVLVESQLSVVVESDAAKSGTESNSMSDGSHLEQREREKELEREKDRKNQESEIKP
jgi:hypothetical protein